MDNINIIGISGSFKDNSINSGLLRKVKELLPDDMNMEIINYRDVPLYDQDVEQKGFPESVLNIADKFRKADALIIATPEYNYSIPGVLKNMLDWVSRFKGEQYPLTQKPIGIIGASPGMSGSMRAQLHLRQIAVELNTYPMAKPELIIPKANDKFDSNGDLVDEMTMQYVSKFISAFREHILKFK